MAYSKPKNPAGRPLKYKTPEALQVAIDAYFDSCWEDEQYLDVEKNVKTRRVQITPYTVTGLALAVGMTREGLIHYAAKDDIFADTVARAKQRCEEYAERYLYSGKNPAGAMFSMVNNWGWVDKKEHALEARSPTDAIAAGRRRAEIAVSEGKPAQIKG